MSARDISELEGVVIRFAGDSGDGMQLTGNRFSDTAAIIGNDIATFPDFPAEIRAPAGSLPGVSGFQIHFSSRDIHTPGDHPDVLVAMNPAALRTNLMDLSRGGLLLVNEDAYSTANLKLAGYADNPLEDGSLEPWRLVSVPMSSMTIKAVEELDLPRKSAERCKNFFALGMLFYLYGRPLEPTLQWIAQKFAKKPDLVKANELALRAGNNFADTLELFQQTYKISRAKLPKGVYRSISGNHALALGLVTACRKAGRPLFYGSYPITPASDILHELSRHQASGVHTFQAEDEIAAIGAAIGASYGGAIGMTGTSGPGLALKAEAMGLAVMAEIPLVVVNVQRGGPSTGLPTKTEQADLLQAIFGRNGECPVPVLAASTPADCFAVAMEAVQVALQTMGPVLVLSDGYLANGAEPWAVPRVEDLPSIEAKIAPAQEEEFFPYIRDPETLARPWAIPGTKGLEHRIGGLEKEEISGNVSYDAENHQRMVQVRAEKVARVADRISPLEVEGPDEGDLLLLGWGSTHGALRSAARRLREEGHSVTQLQLRWLNPLPKDLPAILGRYKKVLLPELNSGQLRLLLRAETLIDIRGLNKVKGQPFRVNEIMDAARTLLSEEA